MTLANFPLPTDCLSIILISEEAIKKIKIITKDCGNFTFTQHLSETFFDPSFPTQIAAQIIEFLLNNITKLNKRLQ